MFIRMRTKAQTTAEYAILFGLVVGALLAMQLYIRRGINSRIKDVVDHTGATQNVAGAPLAMSGGQYEPYYSTSTASVKQGSTDSENVAAGGAATRTSVSTADTTRQTNIGWGAAAE